MSSNPYRSQRERAAFEAGLTAGRANEAKKKRLLTRTEVMAMSTSEINERWQEVQAWQAAGMPEGDDDE